MQGRDSRSDRRSFLRLSGIATLGLVAAPASAGPDRRRPATDAERGGRARRNVERTITLFLCGDVMTGRGIDQVLPHPSDPRLHESWVRSARGYVRLAERAHGAIPERVGFAYPWGEALDELRRVAPAARIVNLETAVTTSDDWSPKGINYRMHPDNVPCITAAGIDCCVLANNHVMDWGRAGLVETLRVLRGAGMRTTGAGRDAAEAAEPAILEPSGGGRLLVFAFGSPTSGIPREWAATADRPGVRLLEDLSDAAVRRIAEQVGRVKRRGDIVVASIHWGGNWGYRVPREQRRFARGLVEEAGVDVVHGHSSHHPKGIEVHRERPILYGCGDFLNDYEGISGQETYRPDLVLIYFVSLDAATGRLVRLEMTPLRTRRFRLEPASSEEARWLCEVLDREGGPMGTRVEQNAGGSLSLGWSGGPDGASAG